ncbi:MAG: sugar phosphate isomerase/epimerase family protein [Candidatus Zipacnadales bacterium]
MASDLKIAIMLGSLRMEPYEGMKKVAELGVTGIHLGVGGGPFAPENMSKADRKQLIQHLASLGLEISAISAWGGQVDLTVANQHDQNIPWAFRLLDLAADLGCGIWQGHIGIIPADFSSEKGKAALTAAQRIAEHGEKVGACLAIETGPEPPVVLKRLIETVGSPAIRINYDPANLILWPPHLFSLEGKPYDKEEAMKLYDPHEGVKILGPYIVHTHAKDALVHEDGKRQEVPLGEGWVDWPRYVSLLKEQGFDGYFAIEREVGEDPVGDITKAVKFLQSL